MKRLLVLLAVLRSFQQPPRRFCASGPWPARSPPWASQEPRWPTRTSTGAAATRCAAGTSRRAATCGSQATASSPRAPAAASPPCRGRGPRALADVHRWQHPRVVAVDETRDSTREADRIRGSRRRRPGTDRARQRLGRRRCRMPSDAEIVVLSPNGSRKFSLDAPAPVSTVERPLARLRRGARGRERARDLTYRSHPRADALRRRRRPVGRAGRAGTDRRDGRRTGDPPGHHRSADSAAGRCALPRLLGGHRRVRDGKQLRLRRISNGNDVLFRTLAPRFQAQLGRRGLVYASGRTLGFAAWVNVTGSV